MNQVPAQAAETASVTAFVLVGPTASGKTDVAHILAASQHARILSADSMLVYRHMDVGTAKPSRDEREAHGYAGVDVVAPDRSFSVADYLLHVRATTGGCAARPWIVVGGTGLYVKCLTQGLDAGPGQDPAARAEARAALDAGGVDALAALVRREAPDAGVKDPANPRRLIRAYERARQGGGPHAPAWSPAMPVIAGLLPERGLLWSRIEARARSMFAGGLIEEARALRAAWPGLSETARHAIGYREAFAVLDGEMRYEDAIERTAVRTRQLAKRQMTWFRHQARVEWVPVAGTESPEWIAAEVLRRWEKHGPARLAI